MKYSPLFSAIYLRIAPLVLPLKIENRLSNTAYRLIVLSLILILRKTQYWSPKKLRELQKFRLNYILRHANNSQFWKTRLADKIYLKSLEELSSLPLLTNKELLTLPKETLITCRPANFNFFESNRTSGTSGNIIEVFFEPRHFYVSGALYYFRPLLAGASFSFRKMLRYFLNHSHLVYRLAIRTNSLKLISYTTPLLLSADEKHFENIYKTIAARRFISIESMPSTILRLADFMKSHSYPPLSPKVLIVSAAEHISEAQKIYIEETVGCVIRNFYAMREILWIGWECERNPNRFHIHAERLIIEIVEHTGKPIKNGDEGEIVITSLDNTLMPIIRYQTGDMGKLIEVACPCGKTLPLIEFRGRIMHNIILPNGEKISFQLLREFFEEETLSDRILQYQIRQDTPNTLIADIIPKPNLVIQQKFLDDIQEKIARFLEGAIKVTVRTVQKIPPGESGKHQTFVPLNPKANS